MYERSYRCVCLYGSALFRLLCSCQANNKCKDILWPNLFFLFQCEMWKEFAQYILLSENDYATIWVNKSLQNLERCDVGFLNNEYTRRVNGKSPCFWITHTYHKIRTRRYQDVWYRNAYHFIIFTYTTYVSIHYIMFLFRLFT